MQIIEKENLKMFDIFDVYAKENVRVFKITPSQKISLFQDPHFQLLQGIAIKDNVVKVANLELHVTNQ